MANLIYLENILPGLTGFTIASKQAIDFSGAPSVALPGSVTVAGAQAITSTSANAFAVGANGTTNPVLNVDASVSSVATGITIQGQAAGSGVKLNVISSGSNEDLLINPKGTGKVVITSSNLNSLNVGPNGATNPVLQVDSSQTSQNVGIKISGNAATFGAVIAVIASGSNENLQINAKGTGVVTLASTSTVFNNANNSFTVGPNGATNPVLTIDSSVASQADGISIQGKAAGSGVAFQVTSSGSNAGLTINGKGTGTITVQSAVAVPAGGSAAASLLMSSTASLGIYFGSGAPTVSAAQGSVYIRTDGSSTSTRLYINTNGSTTWTNVTTAA